MRSKRREGPEENNPTPLSPLRVVGADGIKRAADAAVESL